MGEYEERMRVRRRGQPKRRFAVVAKGEERRAVRNQSAVNGHAVDRRAHAKLADTEKDIASGWIEVEVGTVFENRPGRGSQVRCTADQFGHRLGDGVHGLAAGIAGGHRLRIRGVHRQTLLPSGSQLACLSALELRCQLEEV